MHFPQTFPIQITDNYILLIVESLNSITSYHEENKQIGIFTVLQKMIQNDDKKKIS